jgi:hypothetical protein
MTEEDAGRKQGLEIAETQTHMAHLQRNPLHREEAVVQLALGACLGIMVL